MKNINFPQEREPDRDVSFQETDEGHNENYRRQKLPERYTAYRDTLQVNEGVNDRDKTVNSTNERTDTGRKSCCKIGWLPKMMDGDKKRWIIIFTIIFLGKDFNPIAIGSKPR